MAFLKALSNQPDLQGRKGPQNTSKSIMLLPKLAACAVLQPEEASPQPQLSARMSRQQLGDVSSLHKATVVQCQQKQSPGMVRIIHL